MAPTLNAFEDGAAVEAGDVMDEVSEVVAVEEWVGAPVDGGKGEEEEVVGQFVKFFCGTALRAVSIASR
jgi:hypothetical protein